MTRIEKAEYDRARRARLKEEIAVRKRADYLANKEREDARVKAWGAANKERLLAIKKKYRDNNKEKLKEYSARRPKQILTSEQKAAAIARSAAWRAANPEKFAEQCYLRQRRKIQARPQWVDSSALRDIYLEAQYMQMHVDHIIPLAGKNVSGLHVPWNLQALYPYENKRKGSRYAS